MRRSWATRRVADITTIAIAVERYRLAHRRLPSSSEFAQDEPMLAPTIAQEHVMLQLSPAHYVLAETEPGRNARSNQTWRVVDGRWDRWSNDTTEELVWR